MLITHWEHFLKIFLPCVLIAGFLFGCEVLPDEGVIEPAGTEAPQLPVPKTLTNPKEIEINSAIQKAAAGREDIVAFLLFRISIDTIKYSDDGNLALVWFSLVDKQTGQIQSGEPGLVIAHATGDASQPWSIVFQVDSTFAQELMAIPDAMISQEGKERYLPAAQQVAKDGMVYTGYRLPWTKGKSVRLTGSIGHVFTYKSCPSTCLYAFDFADGSMFEIKAAKHGYVKYAQWTHPNGNTTDSNFIVLEDPSTTPTTYQVYYHLAQNSIPAALRVKGAEVMQGQFIGNVDDTGYSTGITCIFTFTPPPIRCGAHPWILFSMKSASMAAGLEPVQNRALFRNMDHNVPAGISMFHRTVTLPHRQAILPVRHLIR
jgi:hypothetical protein